MDVICCARTIDRRLALVTRAAAAVALSSATAVVVRDQIVLAVSWIAAGAYPRKRGHCRARRAFVRAAATTFTEIAIGRAVAPIVTASWVALFPRITVFRAAARHGQQQRSSYGAEEPDTDLGCEGSA